MPPLFFDIIGLFGTLIVLVSYFLLQQGKIKGRDPKYMWLNIAGSSFIIVSLFKDWNLPSFLIQSIWIVLSIYGLLRLKKS